LKIQEDSPVVHIVADNLTITNAAIADAVQRMDPTPIQDLVRRCEAAGAGMIDINSGPLTRKPEEKMAFLVDSVRKATRLPLLLDTSNPVALEAGLQACLGKAIINGFSLEPDKLSYILPLARKFETRIIGYLLYPNSNVPADGAERLTVALELYSRFSEAGLSPEQLIIDPVVPPLIWQNGHTQAMEVVNVIRTLPDLLGFKVETIAGISNLTSGPGDTARKPVFEQSYVAMLAEAGLTMALVNVFHTGTMAAIRACNILTSTKIFSWY
jgi:5-methyltetrahydrofolate corrinoid/iron sulfur protein methyltransferase